MKKQEVIIKAWGQHWETVKEFTNENGWADFKQIFGGNGDFKGLEGLKLETLNNYDPKYCYWKRPIELDGIEDNNGWNVISLKADLPDEYGLYIFRTSSGKEEDYYFDPSNPNCIYRCIQFNFWRPKEVIKTPIFSEK